jgi:bifunctional non-homologous end joining protein LigD
MSPMPDFIDPMLATLVAAPFDDPDFLYETKWDGFRVQAVVRDGGVRIWTRGRKDAEGYFGPFLDPPTWIEATEAIVDGEVIALDDAGEPSFVLLGDPRGRLVYEAFDLLWLDGGSLLDLPLDERKRRLRSRLRDDPRVRYTEHVVGAGIDAYASAAKRRLEGIVAKDRRSPYVPGKRSRAWLKVKVRPEQELVVGGWTQGIGPASDLAAVLVGVYDDGRLRYAGKVGSGFTRATREELLERLRPLVTDEAPFSPPPPKRLAAGTTWVRPELVIRAEFAGWVGDGMVRQASYKGIDLGKDPRTVVRESPGIHRPSQRDPKRDATRGPTARRSCRPDRQGW